MNNHGNCILVAEDSQDDFEMMQRSFKKSNMLNEIIHFDNGSKVLEFLLGKGEFQNRTLPCIILLDLNLPGADGFEILAAVKQKEDTKKIPVVVLSSSKDEFDIEKCYKMGANSYVVKPVEFDGFIKAINNLNEYWFEISIIPKN